MTVAVGGVSVGLSADSSAFTRAIARAVEKLAQLPAMASRAGASISALGDKVAAAQKRFEGMDKMRNFGAGIAASAGVASAGIAGLGFVLARQASDFEQTGMLIDRIFKGNADSVEDFARTVSSELGTSLQETRTGLVSLGAFLKNSLGDPEAAQEQSKALVQLAADISAAMNVPFAETIQRLQSGLRGETESIEKLNIIIGEGAMRQEALRHGIGKSVEKMNEQEKVGLRLAAIFRQTTDLVGASASEAGTFAGQLSRLDGSFKNLTTSLGQILLPVATEIISAMRSVLDRFNELPAGLKKAIVIGGVISGVLLAIVAAAGTVIMAVGAVGSAFVALGPVAMPILAAIAAAVVPVLIVAAKLIFIVFGVIAAVAVLRTAWEENWGGIRDVAKEAWEGVKSATLTGVKAVLTAFFTVIKAVADIFDTVVRGWSSMFDILKGMAASQVDLIIAILSKVPESIKTKLGIDTSMLTDLSAGLREKTAPLQIGLDDPESLSSAMLRFPGELKDALEAIAGDSLTQEWVGAVKDGAMALADEIKNGALTSLDAVKKGVKLLLADLGIDIDALFGGGTPGTKGKLGAIVPFKPKVDAAGSKQADINKFDRAVEALLEFAQGQRSKKFLNSVPEDLQKLGDIAVEAANDFRKVRELEADAMAAAKKLGRPTAGIRATTDGAIADIKSNKQFELGAAINAQESLIGFQNALKFAGDRANELGLDFEAVKKKADFVGFMLRNLGNIAFEAAVNLAGIAQSVIQGGATTTVATSSLKGKRVHGELQRDDKGKILDSQQVKTANTSLAELGSAAGGTAGSLLTFATGIPMLSQAGQILGGLFGALGDKSGQFAMSFIKLQAIFESFMTMIGPGIAIVVPIFSALVDILASVLAAVGNFGIYILALSPMFTMLFFWIPVIGALMTFLAKAIQPLAGVMVMLFGVITEIGAAFQPIIDMFKSVGDILGEAAIESLVVGMKLLATSVLIVLGTLTWFVEGLIGVWSAIFGAVQAVIAGLHEAVAGLVGDDIADVLFKDLDDLSTALGAVTDGMDEFKDKLPDSADVFATVGELWEKSVAELAAMAQLPDFVLPDLGGLGETAADVSEELTNVPAGFKVAQARFRAISTGDTAAASSGGGGGMAFVGAVGDKGTTSTTENYFFNKLVVDDANKLFEKVEEAAEKAAFQRTGTTGTRDPQNR